MDIRMDYSKRSEVMFGKPRLLVAERTSGVFRGCSCGGVSMTLPVENKFFAYWTYLMPGYMR